MVNLAILCVYALSIFPVISIPWTQVSCGARSQTFLLSVLLYCPLLIIILYLAHSSPFLRPRAEVV